MTYIHRLFVWSKSQQNSLLASAKKIGLNARRGGNEFFRGTGSKMFVVEVIGDEHCIDNLNFVFGSSMRT